MQAVILAGGLGTRLRTVVKDRPKPMATLHERPFLAYQIDFLKGYGVRELVFCVGYLHEQVRDYFGDGREFGVSIVYAVERELLGTAGALKNAAHLLDTAFFVLNGDSFLDVDLAAFRAFHARNLQAHPACLGAIAIKQVPEVRRYGAVVLDPNGRITRFREKDENQCGAGAINAGIYLLQKRILQYIPAARKVSIEKETFPAVLQADESLFGFSAPGYFVDIGTPEGYYDFQTYLNGKQHDHQK